MTEFGDGYKGLSKELRDSLGKSVSEQRRDLEAKVEAHLEDGREANRILRAWITDKTGTSDAERWGFVTNGSFQRAMKKFGQSINEILDPWAKYLPADERDKND